MLICKPLKKVPWIESHQGDNQANGDDEQCECWPNPMVGCQPPSHNRAGDCHQANDWQRHQSVPNGLMVNRETECFGIRVIGGWPVSQVQICAHNEPVKQRQPRERVCGQNHW